jgi:HAD superfamily hydrolase (TIGR01458 family)
MTDPNKLDVDGVLVDIDGVLTTSWKALPGATTTLQWLKEHDVSCRLLTNTTELSRNDLLHTLLDAGFDVELDDFVTAPIASVAYIRSKHPGASCYLIGADAAREDLDELSIVDDDADIVLIGGVSGSIPWDAMNKALRLITNGAPLVSMHRSMTWMTDDGLALDAGVALVAGLEEATGKRAVVCGKPAQECFLQAAALMEVDPKRTAMVGDDLSNDVFASQAVGMIGVLVKTGKFRPEQLDNAEGSPDHVIETIADLPGLLE